MAIFSTPRNQSGSVLIICLFFMALITMLALNSAGTARFESRMSHGVYDLHTAFQASESALGSGENWIDTRRDRPFPEKKASGCTKPCLLWEVNANDNLDGDDKDAAWWTDNARTPCGVWDDATGSTTCVTGKEFDVTDTVKTQPRFVLEEQLFVPDRLNVGIGVPPGRFFYRITSRGTGGTDDAEVLLQSSFVRRY